MPYRLPLFGSSRQLIPWLVGIAVATSLLAIGKQAVRLATVHREQRLLRERITSLKQEQSELTQLLEYVQSPTFAEEQARLRFGLAKPGERLAVLPAPPTVPATAAESSATNAAPTAPNYRRWWHYFFVTP